MVIELLCTKERAEIEKLKETYKNRNFINFINSYKKESEYCIVFIFNCYIIISNKKLKFQMNNFTIDL